MDANSSRARTFFCSSVRRSKSSGTLERREELVGEDLAVADLAGDVGVGLDDPLERGGREALDALVHGAGGARWRHRGGRGGRGGRRQRGRRVHGGEPCPPSCKPKHFGQMLISWGPGGEVVAAVRSERAGIPASAAGTAVRDVGGPLPAAADATGAGAAVGFRTGRGRPDASFPRRAPSRRGRGHEHPPLRADEADLGLGVTVHLPTELVHTAVVGHAQGEEIRHDRGSLP